MPSASEKSITPGPVSLAGAVGAAAGVAPGVAFGAAALAISGDVADGDVKGGVLRVAI